MSWELLNVFPTAFRSTIPFSFSMVSREIIISTDYNPDIKEECGIYKYDVETDTNKIIELWDTIKYYPTKNASIYHSTQHQIIFAGGNNYDDDKTFEQSHLETIMIYDINAKTSNNITFESSPIGIWPTLVLTDNDTKLHIVGGVANHRHIIYNFETNQAKIIHELKNKTHGHALLHNKLSNTLILFGGRNKRLYFNDFFRLDLNKPNSVWTVNKKQKLPKKMSHFGYVCYDNRIIITFAGQIDHGTHEEIYYMDLEGKKSWKKSKVKCPKPGLCHAVMVDNQTVHLYYYSSAADHFCIDISNVLPTKLVNMKINDNEATSIIAEVKCSRCVKLEKETNDLREQKDELLTKQTSMKSIHNEMNKECELFICKNNVLRQHISDNKQVIVNANSERDKFKRQIRELNDKTEQIEEINKNNINDLMKENVTLTQQINEMKQNDKSLQSEIVSLKNKLNSFETEQKELIMENKQLKHEINHLKVQQESVNIDVTKYLDWGPHEIATWIVSLDKNKYLKYYETLKEELENEGVTGKHLRNVNETDIKGWGVVNFDDKKDLMVQINQLVNK